VLWKYLLSHHAQKHLAVPPFKPMSCVVSVLQLSIDPPPFPGSPPTCHAAGIWMQLFLSQMGITLCVLARTEAHDVHLVHPLEDACEKLLNCGAHMHVRAGIVCTHKGPACHSAALAGAGIIMG
jgi:hypothetical protein